MVAEITVELEVYFLVLNVLLAAFLCWVLRNVLHSSAGVIRTTASRRSDADKNTVEALCPCVFGRYSATQVTMGFTVASVTMWLLFTAFAMLASVISLTVCHTCATRYVLRNVFNLFLILGYVMMFVTHFERLRLTFNGTIVALPQWAPKVLYVVWLTVALLSAAVIIFMRISALISGVCGALLLLLYFASVSAMSRAFFTKARKIVSNAEANGDVIDAVVRVTVVGIVSMLSISVFLIQFVVFLLVCPNCLRWRVAGLTLMDLAIGLNAFCLMCTFSSAECYYTLVFGRVHNMFLTQSMQPYTLE